MNTLNHLLVKAHREDLMREAEAQRQSSLLETGRKSNAALAALGRNLVRLGETLTSTTTTSTAGAQRRSAEQHLQTES